MRLRLCRSPTTCRKRHFVASPASLRGEVSGGVNVLVAQPAIAILILEVFQGARGLVSFRSRFLSIVIVHEILLSPSQFIDFGFIRPETAFFDFPLDGKAHAGFPEPHNHSRPILHVFFLHNLISMGICQYGAAQRHHSYSGTLHVAQAKPYLDHVWRPVLFFLLQHSHDHPVELSGE
jgi:hypothetical protein